MDIITLALARKYADKVASPVQSITATDTGLHFVTADGTFDVDISNWESGTKDYLELLNKPLINNVELVGNKTLSDLGVSKVGQTGNYQDLMGKPTIPTKTSELDNDSGLINNSVNDLVHYYNKSQTFNKQEIQDLINGIIGLELKVVTTLPTENIDTNTIYLVKTEGTNSYAQWIYSDNQWYQLGTTDINLVDYYTKSETDNKFVEKQEGKQLSTNDFTTVEKNKLSELSPNSIKEINKNNNNQFWVGTKAEHDALDIDIKNNPLITFNITDDEYILDEIGVAKIKEDIQTLDNSVQSLNNAKADKTEIPIKTSELTNDSGFITNASIPTKTSQLTNDSGFITDIPRATSGTIGGITAEEKTSEDITPVKIDSATGRLYTSGGVAGGGEELDSKQDKPTTSSTVYGFEAMPNFGGFIAGNLDIGNVAIGYKALANLEKGYGNVCVGKNTPLTSSMNNTITIGYGNFDNIYASANNNIAIGYDNLKNFNANHSNNLIIGSSNLPVTNQCRESVIIGSAIGGSIGLNNQQVIENVFVGNGIGSKIKGQANQCTCVGAYGLGSFGTTNLPYLNNSSTIGYGAIVSGNDQVQLGNSSTTTYCYGSVQNRSDKRDKTDIQTTELGLEFINNLNPVQFKWDYRDDYIEKVYNEDGTTTVNILPKDGSKKRNRPHQGFIAQEVKENMDKLGVDFGGYQDHSINGGCDVLSLGYEEFIAPIVKAIQEQQVIIEKQQLVIDELKSEIQQLKSAK